MQKRAKQLLGGAVALTLVAGVSAHVRLYYSGTGAELSWQNPSTVQVVIQAVGSEDVMGDSDANALRNAIDEWNSVSGSTATLVENTDPAWQARTDWSADDIHLLTFDEINSSGYFPTGSGIVAITPLEFYTTGRIIDADVLFNGKDFHFTTKQETNRFDIQDVAAHELGHLLGLDHSGVAGATMYPYVDPSVILHRSLSMDDIGGLRDLYPSTSFGSITGTVKRSGDGSVVPGAYIVVRDGWGRTVGSDLADNNGAFHVGGMESGIFDVWADPLDYPVSAGNLSSGHVIETDFESKYLGQVVLTTGQQFSMGDQMVDPDVLVSLGRAGDEYPLHVVEGRTVAATVSGSGLVVGSTLTASDPTVTVTPTVWGGSYVQFQVTVPANSPLGHIDLLVENAAGDRDLLPGALEVTPGNPVVSTVTPATGPGTGNYSVQITGTGFRAGARVVIGNRIYADGVVGGCTVVAADTIQLTLANTVAGPHDVVVIDASGVEGRKVDGFTSHALPAIESVFPAIGSSDGGTEVTLRGSNFVPGATVTINGVPQTNATVVDSQTLVFYTVAAAPGGPHVLTVQNPGGDQASSAFVFNSAVDPRISATTPNTGPAAGGTEVQIYGSGFHAGVQVVFGADPYTGQGGAPPAR
ncbi:MAG: IPT/TIG domain-containing protein [Planctomycetota bacterium]